MTQPDLQPPEDPPNGIDYLDDSLSPEEFRKLMTWSDHITGLMKILSHDRRIALLYFILETEKTVTDLEDLLGERQSWVSQQLMRLRQEGIVQGRREGREIYYSVRDPRVSRMLKALCATFCFPAKPDTETPA